MKRRMCGEEKEKKRKNEALRTKGTSMSKTSTNR